MAKPFRGIVNIDIKDSTPDWEPYTQPIAPDGAPNVLYVVLDDVGFSAMEPYGGLIETPNIKRIAERGLDVHELPHDGALLADALVPADGPQPHDERHGLHHRGDLGLPERERAHPVRVREHRRGARRARLEHLHRRQVAPLRRGRDEPRLVEAPVAARPRLRALLRLPRRRDEPVVSRPGLRQPPGRRQPTLARGGLPPHGRPHRQGDRVHPGRQGDRAGQAVLPLLLPGRGPRAAPRAEGVGGPVQGQVRHGLRGLPRASCSSARRSSASCPTDAELSPINPYADDDEPRRQAVVAARRGPPWDSLSDDEKQLFCRMAEVYAGFLSHADHELGRLLDYLEESGQLDNTIIVLVSDNGASGEGGPNGSVNENKFFNGLPDTIEENLKYLDELGSTRTYNHYPTGWAWAFNTPFKMWKRYANYEGGTADPMIVSWPKGIARAGEIRRQYTHAIDIVPTLLRVPRRRAAGRRQRLHAEAARGRQLRGQLRRRGCADAEGDAVLLDARHPGDLAQGLEGGDGRARRRPSRGATSTSSAGSCSTRRPTRASATTSPAEHPDKLQELIALWWAEAGSAPGAAARVARRDRDPRHRAAAALEAAHPLHVLPRRRRGARVGRAEHPQPLLHDRRRGGDRRRRRRAACSSRRARASAATRSTSRTASSKYVYNFVGEQVQTIESDETIPTGHVVLSASFERQNDEHADAGHAHPPHPRQGRSARRRS